MTDLERAKGLLADERLKLVVVKDGEVIFKSRDRGIEPMFILAREFKKEARGAALADRVIGRGAAILSGFIGIKEVYGELISKRGIERLDYYKIPYGMKASCEYIKNREGNDYCPIEKISIDIEDPMKLIGAIEDFLHKIRRGEV